MLSYETGEALVVTKNLSMLAQEGYGSSDDQEESPIIDLYRYKLEGHSAISKQDHRA